jgi:cytoskeleton protein RodZ
MNEEHTQPQSEQASVGQILKKHRENAGITIDTMATRLKLTVLQVEAIENDEYQTLGPITFVKGYIKNYCRELKIDSNAILAMLPAPSLPEQPVDMQSFSRRTEKEAHDSRLMIVSYIILAIVIGSSALWWWQNSMPIEEQTSNINVENSIMTEQQAAQTNSAALKQPETTLDKASMPNSFQQSAQLDTQAVEQQTSDELNTATQDNQAVSTVVMTFNEESWVEVYDAAGEKIAYGVKKAGYVMTLTGSAPFSVVLGKHDVVSITLNGEPVDISGFPKNRLAKFKLPLAE